MQAGISEPLSFNLAFQRLYGTWPEFYPSEGCGLAQHIQAYEPTKTNETLVIESKDIQEIIPDSQIKKLPLSAREKLQNPK